jgi:hypothetical protein
MVASDDLTPIPTALASVGIIENLSQLTQIC